MYWQVKLFFASIILLVVGGIVFFTWDHLPKLSSGTTTAAVGTDPATPTTSAPTGNDQSPAARIKTRPPKKGISSQHAQKLNLADQLFESQKVLQARKMVENILADPEVKMYSAPWVESAMLLSKINTHLLFTGAACPEKEDYIVKNGDSLWKISRKFNVSIPMIARGNHLDLEKPKIFPDMLLRIYAGAWNVRVSKSHYLLSLYDGDRLMKVYRIGVGKQDRTPLGKFIVTTKQKDPTWYFRGEKIPAGDPRNALGTRWMALKGTESKTFMYRGYGIHGTIERNSIGTQASNGCVRMLNEQVEELYDIIPTGTPVLIDP